MTLLDRARSLYRAPVDDAGGGGEVDEFKDSADAQSEALLRAAMAESDDDLFEEEGEPLDTTDDDPDEGEDDEDEDEPAPEDADPVDEAKAVPEAKPKELDQDRYQRHFQAVAAENEERLRDAEYADPVERLVLIEGLRAEAIARMRAEDQELQAQSFIEMAEREHETLRSQVLARHAGEDADVAEELSKFLPSDPVTLRMIEMDPEAKKVADRHLDLLAKGLRAEQGTKDRPRRTAPNLGDARDNGRAPARGRSSDEEALMIEIAKDAARVGRGVALSDAEARKMVQRR